MDGLNLKSAVAGVVLIVVVVLVAVFKDSPLSEFEDESVVVAALTPIDSVERNCEVSYGGNADRVWAPLRLWGEEDTSVFTADPDDVINYSHTWYTDSLQPFGNDSIKTVNFNCNLFWDPDELSFRIGIRYPLKTGIYSEQINVRTRNHIAGLLLNYFSEQIETNSSFEGFSYEAYLDELEELNAPEVLLEYQKKEAEKYENRTKNGAYLINSVATFANDNLYSIIYHTEMNPVNDPEYVWHGLTTKNYVIDKGEGKSFTLDEIIDSSGEAYDALVLNSIDDYQGVDEDLLSLGMLEIEIIEEMRETPFSLDKDYLSIGCEQFCDTGILRGRAYWGGFYKIPWEKIERHLIDDGPLRLVRQK